MSRLLALVAFLLLAWIVLRRARAALLASQRGQELRAVWQLLRQIGAATGAGGARRYSDSSPGRGGSGAGAEVSKPIELVRCAVCGTHVPEEKSRRGAGGVYCSEACEQRAPR